MVFFQRYGVYAQTPYFRFAMIVGDKSQEYCDEFNIDWDESSNDSVLNVYGSDLSTLSFGSTVITAIFKWATSFSTTLRI